MTNLISMVCPPGAGCPLTSLTSLGLPETLLWVMTFAIIFGVLTQLKILKRAPALLVSIATAFFVLMAVPVATIGVIASMSTGLVILSVGVIVIVSLLMIASPFSRGPIGYWVSKSNWVTIALLVIVALLFAGSGGLALIGLGTLPSIGTLPMILVIVGAAVLWMIADAGEKPQPAEGGDKKK